MSWPGQPRHVVLAVLLAATLVAAFWPQNESDDTVIEAVKDRPARQSASPAEPTAALRSASFGSAPSGSATSSNATSITAQTEPEKSETIITESTTESLSASINSNSPAPRFALHSGRDLFPAQTFKPPPPKPAPPPPPPPPTAPPVPFVFIGAWTEDGRETLFLGQGERTLSVHRGDVLPGGWRLDEIKPDALTLTYLSLNQQRTLRIAP